MPVRKCHLLAALQQAALPTVRNSQPVRLLDVEPPRPLVLHEPVSDGVDVVVDLEAVDDVAVPLEPSSRLELDELYGVRESPEDPPQRDEQLLEPARPVDRQRDLAAAERERLQHAREPEVVVRVVVGQEDLLEVDQPQVATQQLPLRPLGAVDEQPVAAAPHERRAERALRRRHGARRPEEDDVQLHGARF